MFFQQLYMGILGVCAGSVAACGIIGLLCGLSIIPRFATVTHTKNHLMKYESSMILGILLGNYVNLFHPSLPLGWFFLFSFGFFSGMFVGGWILSLAELADMLSGFIRRIHLKKGLPWIILSLALGKTFGSLLFYYLRW